MSEKHLTYFAGSDNSGFFKIASTTHPTVVDVSPVAKNGVSGFTD
jgi:hypothetical protein